MFLGLDVGGTHTDAVIIDEKGIVASSKVITRHNDLLGSVADALEGVFKGVDLSKISRINLSTTLSTNAIVENKIDDVAVFISSGPGIDPESFRIGSCFNIIDGSIDHRGTEIKPIDREQVEEYLKKTKDLDISLFAVVTKFSTRNPDHENLLKDMLNSSSLYTTCGHQLSGQLNFPRRIATAYYNSAIWRIYNTFADAIRESFDKHGIKIRINILKADGGTLPLAASRDIPVETILSGPAASVMGIIALCDIHEDSIIIDIGGTTSDIAVFISGSPLLEEQGISLNEHHTLVRALKTRSIGIGGDSSISINDKKIKVGPERLGPCMADGGSHPALVDAFNYTKMIQYNDISASVSGIEGLAQKHGIDPKKLAEEAIQYAVNRIKQEVDALIEGINTRPVYTVYEIIRGKELLPKKLYLMGGPAKSFSPLLKEVFGVDVVVPENYSIANAIGAALTCPTMEIELFADTEKCILLIPNLNIRKEITPDYNIDRAQKDAKDYLIKYMKDMGIEEDEASCEVIEVSSFNIVSGFYTSGKNIRVKCQVRPCVLKECLQK